MIIFCYMPIYGLTIAFKSYTVIDTIDSAKWVGWANFKIVATDKYFWQSVINTLGISFLKLLIGFTTPIILSIMIYELRDGPFKRIIQTISYLPHFLSWIVLGGMIINWLSTTGLLNQILMAVGLVDNPTNFYWIPGNTGGSHLCLIRGKKLDGEQCSILQRWRGLIRPITKRQESTVQADSDRLQVLRCLL